MLFNDRALWWLLGLPGSGRTPIDTAERAVISARGGTQPLVCFPTEDALVLEKRRVPPSQTPIDRVRSAFRS